MTKPPIIKEGSVIFNEDSGCYHVYIKGEWVKVTKDVAIDYIFKQPEFEYGTENY